MKWSEVNEIGKLRFSTSGKEVSSDDSAGASRPGMITTSSLGLPLFILGSVAPRQGRVPLGEPATLLCLEKGQGKFSFTHPYPLSHHQTRDYAGTLRVLQTRSSDTPCPGSGTHSNATIVPTSSAPVRAGRRQQTLTIQCLESSRVLAHWRLRHLQQHRAALMYRQFNI